MLFAAAAAAHHATLLFGSFFFAVPVAWRWRSWTARKANGFRPQQFVAAHDCHRRWWWASRSSVVLLPFWIALIHYPVTQTPIPHPSRANYILSPQWGLNYFIVPYGALILALPFIFLRGSAFRACARCCWASGSRSCSDWAAPPRSAAFFWAAHLKCSPWSASATGRPCWRCRSSDCWPSELIDRFRKRAVVGLDGGRGI